MLLESAFHKLFCLKFQFKLVTFSKSYARKQKWVFFLNSVYISIPSAGQSGLWRHHIVILSVSICSSVRSITRFVNTVFLKQMSHFWCIFAQGSTRKGILTKPCKHILW